MRADVMTRMTHRCAWVALAAGWLALLSRLPGDRWLPAAVISYGSPWLLTGAAGLAAFFLLRPSWKWLALPVLGFAVQAGWRSLDPGKGTAAAVPAFTAATWNAAHCLAAHPQHWDFPADLTVITETGDFDGEGGGRTSTLDDFRSRHPGMEWQRYGDGLTLGVRGRILAHESFGDPRYLRCVRAEVVTAGGHAIDVILVDIRSQPWLSRRPSLEAIFEKACRGRPTLVMGDFNTPAESMLLDKATAGRFLAAHESPVRGFRETWPWGIPLLTLDQIWAGGGLVPVSHRKEIRHSDHAYVEAVIGRAGPG